MLANEDEGEVFAPVAMWFEAIDLVLSRLKEKNAPLNRIRGVSGACQQHGSVFWSHEAEGLLGSLEEGAGLKAHLESALSYPYGPNWQDHSTQKQCDEFDASLGSKMRLAEVTGSAAHHVSFSCSGIITQPESNPGVTRTCADLGMCSGLPAPRYCACAKSSQICTPTRHAFPSSPHGSPLSCWAPLRPWISATLPA